MGGYANRIHQGKFTLNQQEYALTINSGEKSPPRWEKKSFQTCVLGYKKKSTISFLQLHYLSKDGKEGYPGNLYVVVNYELTNQNKLKISYEAQSDQSTSFNLIQPFLFQSTWNRK
ncbi:MAG: hypothetical protein ACMUEM_06305 [Flavobacteriales bacterium AspAUS03]